MHTSGKIILDSSRLDSIPRWIPVIPIVSDGEQNGSLENQPRRSRYVTRIMATYQVGRGRVKVVGTMVAGGSSRAPKRDLGKKGLLARLLSLSFCVSYTRAYSLSLFLSPSLPSSSLCRVCACNRPRAHHSLFNWSTQKDMNAWDVD